MKFVDDDDNDDDIGTERAIPHPTKCMTCAHLNAEFQKICRAVLQNPVLPPCNATVHGNIPAEYLCMEDFRSTSDHGPLCVAAHPLCDL